MWLAASSFAVPDGVLATLTTAQLSGKPHQGVPAKTLASPPGIGECNSTAAIGLQASLALNGLRQSERARYYGNALGRWTSPDTINLTDERILSPTNTLNKYVYGANNPLKFLDPDGRDVIAFYDHGGLAGHSMVLAYNQDTGDYAVKDYGPAHRNGGDNGDRLIELAGGKISGVDDYSIRNVSSPQGLRDNYSSLTIQTSPETAQEVINAIRSSYGNEPKEFNAVYGPNCSSSCSTVLKALGIGKDQTPAGLWGDLFRRYAKNRNSSHGFNYVFGTFYPHQNNTEYGNPRYSVDSFDLLFKLLFPSKGCVTVSDSASKSTFGGCN